MYQYGDPIELDVFSDVSREAYLGFFSDGLSHDAQLVAITFFRLRRGTRDVDILREAGIMQHLNHQHVLPKFFGMALVAPSEEYCQWVTVAEFANRNSSAPVGTVVFQFKMRQ